MEPIRQGVRERFGTIGEGVARGLRLRHDHGSNYLADDFQQEVAFFGIESSPSFVREPEGNGVAERFIRTLKENLLWVRSFDTIETLRLALLAFKRTYNEQWMREGLYSSSLSTWRRQGAAGALAGTGSVKRGPKAPPKDVRDTRIAELERETRRLQRKLTQAETIIGIQKKVATLLGTPLQSVDDDEHD